MSTGTNEISERGEAIERQRQMLYAPMTDEQLIMSALHHVLETLTSHFPALQRELYDRSQGVLTQEGKTNGTRKERSGK